MKLYDYECENGHVLEELVEGDERVFCPECGKEMHRTWKKAAATLTTIIPTYPGCKRMKAGYEHTSHADQPATRIQAGYGGCQGPKS